MKRIISILAVTALLASCQKEKTTAPVTVLPKDYTGQWTNVSKSPQGPLDYFKMQLVLNAGNAGVSDFVYTSPVHNYPQTSLSWQKIAGDSVVIELNIPAYPNETWELRGLNNNDNSVLAVDYFSIPNNDPAGKFKYGSMEFKH